MAGPPRVVTTRLTTGFGTAPCFTRVRDRLAVHAAFDRNLGGNVLPYIDQSGAPAMGPLFLA